MGKETIQNIIDFFEKKLDKSKISKTLINLIEFKKFWTYLEALVLMLSIDICCWEC